MATSPPKHQLFHILTLQKIAFQVASRDPNSSFEIFGTPDLDGCNLGRLPSRIVVHGSLHIRTASISKMPDHLVVQKSLYASRCLTASLPERTDIGGDVWLDRSHITSLPHAFKVRGDLNLLDSRIAALPENLDVSGELNLYGTAVRRFPSIMHVGKRIFPSPELQDIQDLMANQEEAVVFSHAGSAHQKLAQADRLRGFPDLLRVVQNMPIDNAFHIWRMPDGRVAVRFAPIQMNA
ncbi:MAG: hypothetical protein ACRYGG_00210 [Janthinobacterium lividum]